MITKYIKKNSSLLIVILLGAFLRFYRINQNFIFDGEIGDNLLDIKNAWIHQQIPLLGAPTSHPWLSFGPLFYWFYAPVLILAKFNPISHAYFGAFIGLMIIPLNFLFVKKLFNKTAANISSYLIAISPLFINIAHLARFYGVVVLLLFPFLLVIWGIVEEKKRQFFLAGVLLGIILNFHYSPVILLPFLITLFLIRKITLSFKHVLQFIVGLLLPLSPLIYYYARYNPKNLLNIALWVPYRVAGFFGLYPKNTFSQTVLKENNSSFLDFLGRSFFSWHYQVLTYPIIVLLGVFIFWQIKVYMREKKGNLPLLFLMLWFTWAFIALFIHGSPPLHYYVSILPIPIIIFSLLLTMWWEKTMGKIVVIILLGILTILNFQYYFSTEWFYRQQEKADYNYYVPYVLQQKVAHIIIADANGKLFSLKRIGVNDEYALNFAQNYIYLLWLYGNEPVQKAKTIYTIYDYPLKQPHVLIGQKIFSVSNISITKNE